MKHEKETPRMRRLGVVESAERGEEAALTARLVSGTYAILVIFAVSATVPRQWGTLFRVELAVVLCLKSPELRYCAATA